MSALLRWRCDICHTEAETVQEVTRETFSFFHPKLPDGWMVKPQGKKSLDLCSQSCVVVYHQRVLAREQRKLADSSTNPVVVSDRLGATDGS